MALQNYVKKRNGKKVKRNKNNEESIQKPIFFKDGVIYQKSIYNYRNLIIF